jgi:hypothetical protein
MVRLCRLVTVPVAVILAGIVGVACAPTPPTVPARSPVSATADPLAHTLLPRPASPPGAVLTQRGDPTRLGWYSDEHTLTVSSVGGGHFGRRAAYPVDGKVYAQPLYVPSPHMVIVATEHDSVYAFDANATGTLPPPLWHASLLQVGARPFLAATDRIATDRLCDSITPEVGITSTPVIDWPTRSLYVVALDVEHGTLTYRMHRLDLLTGKDSRPSTVIAAGSPGHGVDAVGGRVAFHAGDEQQRVGLTLDDGVVYAGFASWCGLSPYHGWILGYRQSDLSLAITFDTTPDRQQGGVWQSEAGLAVDEHGHLFAVTGNGQYDLDRGGSDAGDSILELAPEHGALEIVDSFTPFDQLCRYQHDQDLGSGSPLFVPGHDEIVLSSKTGAVYVLNRAGLGGYTVLPNACRHRDETTVDHVRQELSVDSVPGGMWGTWGYWRSPSAEFVYGSGAAGRPTQWRLNPDGTLATPPVAQAPEALTFPGAIPVVSSAGSTPGTGVVWTVDQTHGAVLRAYDASDIAHEIWTSAADSTRDSLDGFDHFTVPTVADGLVFVGDQSHLEIYGLIA